MLRTAGPDAYDQWWQHEIPWTDESVRAAWETWGEIIAVAAVLREGAALGLDALNAWCAGRLSAYKFPRRLAIVASLPADRLHAGAGVTATADITDDSYIPDGNSDPDGSHTAAFCLAYPAPQGIPQTFSAIFCA